MTTREERADLLVNQTGPRIRGLAHDPCLTAYLNEFDRADAEGLNRLVEQTLSEIKRSGHLSGFEIELAIANISMDLPCPRLIRCEQKEGLCVSPGDIWIDKDGIRYEFQCKHSLNWTVEIFVEEALDRIITSTRDSSPGFIFGIEPLANGLSKDWLAFSDWVIANYSTWELGRLYTFESACGPICRMSLLMEDSHPGLHFGSGFSPEGSEWFDQDLLRKKLKSYFAESRKSISARPSANQLNFLAVGFKNLAVEEDDIAQALYGTVGYRMHQGGLVGNRRRDGLYFGNLLELWSGLILTRLEGCDPLTAKASVFPNPRWAADVRNALKDFPRTDLYIPKDIRI